MKKYQLHIWIGCLMLAWLLYMFYTNYWGRVFDNLNMTGVMSFASFIAGSTPLGGGAVAFPILTILYKIPTPQARDFSLMIQAVGMTSASVSILFFKKVKLNIALLLYCSIAGVLGVFLATTRLDGLLNPQLLKVGFMAFLSGFLLNLVLSKSYFNNRATNIPTNAATVGVFMFFSFIGGIVSGWLGTGIDIIVFSLLGLFYKVKYNVATAFSVVLMSIISIFGALFRVANSSQLVAYDTWSIWYAAIPAVIIGAPMGALFIRTKSNNVILGLILLCFITELFFVVLLVPQTQINLLVEATCFLISFSIYYYSLRYYEIRTTR